MQRWIKISLISMAGMGGLFLLILAFTQTGIFRNWLKEQVIAATNPMLNGELRIDALDGSLFSSLEINGLYIYDSNEDTVAAVKRIYADYAFWDLLSGTVWLDSVIIDQPRLYLAELPDSSWNVAHLVKTDSTAPPPDTSNSPLGWAIELRQFDLRNGHIYLRSENELIPEKVQRINSRFSASYRDDQQAFTLAHFSFATLRPDFQLNEVSFKVAMQESSIHLEDLIVKSAANQLTGALLYTTPEDTNTHAEISTDPLVFQEFEFAMPDIHLKVRPKIDLVVDVRKDSLEFTLDILENNRGIALKGGVSPVSRFLDNSVKRPCYGISGNIRALDLAHWMNDTTMAHLINGDFWLQGCGIEPGDAVLASNLTLSNSVFNGLAVDKLALNGSYKNRNGAAKLQIDGGFGNVRANLQARDVLDQQQFKAQLNARNINLAAINADDSLQSDIDAFATIDGAGFDPAETVFRSTFHLRPSTIMDLSLDTMFSVVTGVGQDYRIDTLDLKTPYLSAALSGKANPDAETNIAFTGQLGELNLLKHFAGADSLAASGKISGNISGRGNDWQLASAFGFKEIVFNEVAISNIDGALDASSDLKKFAANTVVDVRETSVGTFLLDHLQLNVDATDEQTNLLLSFRNADSLSGIVNSAFIPGDVAEVQLPEIDLKYRELHWQGGGAEMKILLDADEVIFEDIRLAAPHREGGEQYLHLDGSFSMTGEESLKLEIVNVDIAPLAAIAQSEIPVGGNFNAQMLLAGNADAPILDGHFGISNGSVASMKYESFHTRFDYAREKFSWRSGFRPASEDSINLNGYFPLNLALNNTGDVIFSDRPLEIVLHTAGFALSQLNATPESVETLKGTITSDLRVTNTLNDIRTNGYFRLQEGVLQASAFGLDYEQMLVDVSADSARINLNNLQIHREEGLLKANGHVAFDSSLVSGQIRTTLFEMTADNFVVARNNDFEIQISGNSKIAGAPEALEYGGGIEILRSSVYLPAFIDETPPPVYDDAYPMLVAATQKDSLLQDGVAADSIVNPDAADATSEIFENLRGSLKLSIPRNTWIKSKEMRMELSGDLDIVKNGPEFEIFGPVEIMRGHYEMLGRRFTVQEGVLTFQGGSEYDPNVLLVADHVFRTASRDKKTLTLKVTGTAFQPVISFLLDEDAINEGDAIAYLFFGRSMDELTSSQKSGIASEESGLAEQGVSAGIGMATAMVTQAVGRKFNLDYIELKGEDNWQKATFVAGKYITNDLFMSYERDIDFTQSEQSGDETISLEYELIRHLYLQLIQGSPTKSGAELILKIER